MASKSFLTSILFSIILFVLFPLKRAENLEHLEAQIADQLLNKTRYDPRIRPNSSSPDGHVDVTVSMFIIDMSNIDEENMAVTISAYFRQKWNDPRLEFNNQNSKVSTLTRVNEESIWKPDLFFINERKGFRHQIVADNSFLRINRNGDVLYSIRVTLKLACPMDFKLFPFDSQVCTLEIESYGYTTQDINLQWVAEKYILNENLVIPEYTVVDSSTERSIVQMKYGQSIVKKYCRLTASIKIKRKFNYYLTHVYIPLYNLVLLSWISFWLKLNPVALRFSFMLVIYAMTLTFLMVINYNTIVMSVTSAQNVWTGVCLTFIFLALIECLLVYQFSFKENQEKDQEIEEVLLDKGAIDRENEKVEAENKNTEIQTRLFSKYLNKYKNKSERIDVISRVVYPVLFIIFNIIYWSYYCTVS